MASDGAGAGAPRAAGRGRRRPNGGSTLLYLFVTGKMYAMKEICVKPRIYHIVATSTPSTRRRLDSVSTVVRPTHSLIYAQA